MAASLIRKIDYAFGLSRRGTLSLVQSLLVCSLILIGSASIAQQDSLINEPEPIIRGVGLNVFRGFVLGQSPQVAHLSYQPTLGIQLDIMPSHIMSKPWRNAYRGANIGYTLLVNSNGPNRVLGTSVAAGLYMETHIIRRTKHKLMLRAAFGPVWSSSPFNLTDNPLNVAVGSSIAALLQGNLTYCTPITPALWLRAGLVFTHYSNGSYTMPNYGLNMPSVGLGFNYYVQPAQQLLPTKARPIKLDTLPAWRKSWRGYLIGQVGLAENFPTSGPKYSTIALIGYAAYRVGLKSSLTGGVEYMYNNSLKPFSDKVPEYQGKDITRYAVTVGHDLHISKVDMHTQLGIYVYKPLAFQGAVYQRLTLTYNFWDRCRAGVSLKLHGFSAETLEGTLGVRVF